MMPDREKKPGEGQVYGDTTVTTKKSGPSWLLWLVVLIVVIALLLWAFT
ncbi:hypothetical protein [Telmatospirillum sp. J64-1]|nr:hypothetical protein [Telmatospirillum sp. J64-1]